VLLLLLMPPPPITVATCHHRAAVMWLIVASLMDEIASKEEIADIHDELFFCAWFVTCVFSCVDFLPLDREILNGQLWCSARSSISI
jgi:hypothetical protein